MAQQVTEKYIVWLGGNDNWRGYCADNVFQSILVSFSKNKRKKIMWNC